MLANLAQLSSWVWIVAIIVIIVVAGVIFWARRRRLHVTGVELTAGPAKVELETEKPAPTLPVVTSPSVNISGNKMFGKNIIGVRRDKTNVSDNIQAAENEIGVGAKPGPKPKPVGKKKCPLIAPFAPALTAKTN